MFLFNVKIPTIYIRKTAIKHSDMHRPFSLVTGIKSNMATIISVAGKRVAIQFETGSRMGDVAICSLNIGYSRYLLMPVYKKRTINIKEIISTIVLLFIPRMLIAQQDTAVLKGKPN